MSDWKTQFQPIVDHLGWSVRDNQAKLGNAIIDTIESNGKLIGEASTGTGKSLASLIPVISKIHQDKDYRAVISTETITLQSQIAHKDLPMLEGIYGGFTYKKLMGRSNYLCKSRAAISRVNDTDIYELMVQIDKAGTRIDKGEKPMVELALGYKINDYMWSKISGDSEFCVDNNCAETEDCYGSLARMEAAASNIVVTNHALLATDMEMRSSGREISILGGLNAVIVDEAHQFESVVVDALTDSYNDWEISQLFKKITKGVTAANQIVNTGTSSSAAGKADQQFSLIWHTIKSFFIELNGGAWDRSETAISEKFVAPGSSKLTQLMEDYEEVVPGTILNINTSLFEVIDALGSAIEKHEDALGKGNFSKAMTKKGAREARAGINAAAKVIEFNRHLYYALQSKDGISVYNGKGADNGSLNEFGRFGLVAYGSEYKGEKFMRISIIPLDVSQNIMNMWKHVNSVVAISATLRDPTDGSLKYAKRSLGLPWDCREVVVDTPFNLKDQQLVYISDGNEEKIDGAMYSMDELIDLINYSDGRALVLFTSRKELNQAVDILEMINGKEGFPHRNMYIQRPDSDKQKLVADFKEDTRSILIGLKSFFTGIDIPGESLSLVIMCRFPLPRFSAETKMKISYWKNAGFPQWYEREALTVFQQGAGRLIRSDACKGVVALLDQRASDPGSSVHRSVRKGVKSLGSHVTHDIQDVKKFLGKVV